jgi:hypothetical protein
MPSTVCAPEIPLKPSDEGDGDSSAALDAPGNTEQIRTAETKSAIFMVFTLRMCVVGFDL